MWTGGRGISAANVTFERRRTGISKGAVADGECATEVNGEVGWEAESVG